MKCCVLLFVFTFLALSAGSHPLIQRDALVLYNLNPPRLPSFYASSAMDARNVGSENLLGAIAVRKFAFWKRDYGNTSVRVSCFIFIFYKSKFPQLLEYSSCNSSFDAKRTQPLFFLIRIALTNKKLIAVLKEDIENNS